MDTSAQIFLHETNAPSLSITDYMEVHTIFSPFNLDIWPLMHF